jgi:hypothetical protein
LAENVTLSVGQKYKKIWTRFRAKHPHAVSPTIMELIEQHVNENPEKYVEAKTE